jgi:hypothetical protein
MAISPTCNRQRPRSGNVLRLSSSAVNRLMAQIRFNSGRGSRCTDSGYLACPVVWDPRNLAANRYRGYPLVVASS